MSNNKKEIVVLYHGNCPDGFTAAWIAWKKFGDSAEYIPLLRYNILPDVRDSIVYMLDYCPNNLNDLSNIIKNNKELIVIDHHKSSEEVIKNLPGSVFDNNHSGAVLTWKYFFPNEEPPVLAKYIEDRDLWNWKLPNTKEILNMVDLNDLNSIEFSVFDKINSDISDSETRAEYIKNGLVVDRFRNNIIQNIVDMQTQLVEFEGYEIYAANCPRFFVSEVGNKLATMKPPFAIAWSSTPEKISISMRSVNDFDVSKIAEKYGAGGHQGAASFSIPHGAPFPWKVINKK